MPNMPGMQMDSAQPSTPDKTTMPMNMSMDMMKPPTTLIDTILNHTTSGTSAEPASTPVSMLMRSYRGWMLMLHGTASISDTQQHASNPTGAIPDVCVQNDPCPNPAVTRGGNKLFSTNWIMPMAMRQLGSHGQYGQLTLRTMLSLEPATITSRQFPELFQQGETAFGKPIIDGQHPHDFFMELAALYDLRLGSHTLLSLYAAPVGDPAIGPTAYPHRHSASEDPIAALGHHQEDSTHIAFNVFTGGITWRWLRFEESGFHGAEPTEQRWGFQPSPNGHAVDSYSSRITFAPTKNLSTQYSIAHIVSPEALYPNENQQRQTASIIYNLPFGHTTADGDHTNNWSNTLLWGRTKSLTDNSKENSYLLESLLNFRTRNYVWTRIENAGRSNELLIPPGSPLPPNFTESPLGHVAAYSFGYDRDYRVAPHLLAAPGAQFTTYTTPSALVSIYGSHPFGAVAFVRLRIAK
ncbi:hypothetical protein [Tunturibacter empetritectus]|uniref:Uncharacterized protein n=1 Tax=Tunturiibacter empetritectus TaxID=3069691 RepID=A0A7W8IFP7_9BACT|nr:hypothetical protein [Edaphobacter lichenicola]MBB5316374.1 hypothetical protein [Edaphobacter lichenicola]